jgi:glycosyltransferase EpsF
MNLGGTEVMVMELLRHKNPSTIIDFLVHVRDIEKDRGAAFDAEILARGARLLPIITPARSGVLAYMRSFKTHIQKIGKPDVIHVHVNARSGIVALAAWIHRIPRIIIHSHAELTFRGSFLYRLAARLELAVSKFIFIFSATDFWGCSRPAINSLFPKLSILLGKRTSVINNAIAIDDYMALEETEIALVRSDLGGGSEEFLVGTVGRLVRHKNAGFLIHVLSVLRQRGVPAKLALIGREQDRSYVDEIRSLAEDLGLQKEVVWCGERGDIAKVMAACDVFASPALKEGFGLVAIEAQAAGTPCVISKGFPTSVDLGVGLVRFVEDFNAETWADEVMSAVGCRLARNESLKRAFSAAGFISSENTKRVEHAYRNPDFLPGNEGA